MKITEAQLKQLIRESLDEVMNEEDMDEGLWGGIKGGAKAAWNAVKGELGKVKRGAFDTGLNNEYKGETFGNRLKTAANHVKTGFRGGDKQQELNRAAQTVQSLIDGKTFGGSNILSAPNTVKATQTLLKAINMAKMGSVGGVKSAFTKRYGAPQQPQQPQAQRQVAESKLDKIIRESIKKHIG